MLRKRPTHECTRLNPAPAAPADALCTSPRSCKPIAGGYINVTNSHQLVSTYIGQEQQWLTAVEDISRGGWRNEARVRLAILAKHAFREKASMCVQHQSWDITLSCRSSPAAPVAIENGKQQSWRVTALEGRRFCCCLLDLGA